jgi:RNA polymerase sigma-70 factor (ECF subfamily)
MAAMDARPEAGGAGPVTRDACGVDPADRPRSEVSELSDQIRAAQSGHELAFRLVYQAVQPGLLRYLRSIVGEGAEEVAGETWSRIAHDLRAFRGDAVAFREWIATIARQRALHRRRPSHPAIGPRPLDRHDTGAPAMQQTDRAVALIASLPGEMAEAVLLRAVLGLDARAAARVLGTRAATVRTAAHRGLLRLAGMLRESDPLGAVGRIGA